jgi:serine/threonine protein phosphatase PrpC
LAEEKYFEIALSGTCATLVIQLPKLLIMAWVGDSLVAMQTTTKPGDRRDYFITKPPHTTYTPSEKERIYQNGGETRIDATDGKDKIYQRTRMYPGLKVSRSLGDLLGHHIGVTS